MTLVRIAKGLRCSVDQLLVGFDPDYDRVREAGCAPDFEPAHVECTAATHAEIPVVAEGDALPRGVAGDGRQTRQTERSGVLQWVSRPGDLSDPDAYGIRIRGDSMIPAHRPNTIAIVAPTRRVQDGDEVYVQLASGERLIRVAQTVRAGFMLQSYNHAYRAFLVQRQDVCAMDVVVSSRLAEF